MSKPAAKNELKNSAASTKRSNEGDTLSLRSNEHADESRNETLRLITNRLLGDIRSLQLASREVSSALNKNAEKHLDGLKAFLLSLETRAEVAAAFEEVLSDKKATRQVSLPIPLARVAEFKRVLEELSIAQTALPLTDRGLFLVLISKWDAYIGSILRWVFSIKPEIIDNSERAITFAELKDFGSVDIARERIIDDEAGAVLRESHIDHFDYLEKRLGVKLRKDLDVWPIFVELTQRRHLIAHTDCRVTRQYLKVCKDHNVKLDDKTRLGRSLGVDKDYFATACHVLTELAVKLSQVLWRKLRPDEVTDAERHLTDTTFEMIKAGQYQPAISILSFAMQPPMKFTNLRTRLISTLNLAQAYKWSGKKEQCGKTVASEDWSATNIDLRLVVAVLNDDFVHASKLMKELGDGEAISKSDYREWPIFQEFRKSQEFLGTFKDIFKTNIEVRQVSADMLTGPPRQESIETNDAEVLRISTISNQKAKRTRARRRVS